MNSPCRFRKDPQAISLSISFKEVAVAYVHQLGIRGLPNSQEREAQDGPTRQCQAVNQVDDRIDVLGWNGVSHDEIPVPDPLSHTFRI